MSQGQICRPLKSGELALAQSVFSGAITYGLVKIHDHPAPHPKAPKSTSHHYRGEIYLVGGDYRDDISTADNNTKAIFIHEMAHVWQHQSGVRHTSFTTREAKGRLEAELEEVKIILKDLNDRIVAGRTTKHTHWIRDLYAENVSELQQRVLDNDRLSKTRLPSAMVNPLVTPVQAPVRLRVGVAGVGTVSHTIKDSVASMSRADAVWNEFGPAGAIGSRDRMLGAWQKRHLNDYDYTQKQLDHDTFYKLNSEAQAQVVTEYFLIKNDVDPRSTEIGLLVSGRPRAPLKVYESAIPFVRVSVSLSEAAD